MASLPTARPVNGGFARLAKLIAAFLVVALASVVPATMADAQLLNFPTVPKQEKKPRLPQRAGQDQMLVQAARIDYDYVNHRVAAVGNVQIFYQGSTLEADRVTYDEKTKRLHADGNVRLTDEYGNVTNTTSLDLNENFRDGFIDSLHVDTADRTRMAAASATRTAGTYTVFESGVYTACEPCKDNPKKPPLWQVKAARIIHDQGEKMMYFESARFELYGFPIAYFPYFSAPDPTVKRKTGFLVPTIRHNSIYGAAVDVPYYWALAPNYDATFSPMITTKQGVLLQGEFRQRLENGSYSIRAAGISQLDKDYFSEGAPGHRTNRGSLESTGRFALNQQWVWGWQGVLLSDRSFLADYKPSLSAYKNNTDPTSLGLPGLSEATSQIYITGLGDRSFFDARAIHYYGFSNQDSQKQLPVIHPVIDYNYTHTNPVLGGELSHRFNFISLTRSNADFDAVSSFASQTGACSQTADPAVKNRANCLLRGAPGTYNRFSAESSWKKTIVDSYGQMFTPFASVRMDVSERSTDNEPGVSNYLTTGDNTLVRGMPTIGMEYRYPFMNVQSWGTQTFEPIAQVIARPNESQIGKWQNEDAQSFTFDDTNLLKVDKFSGWDRSEGGGRANVAVQYTAQANSGGTFSALFGQSYQLFGENSFAQADATNSTLQSGIDTARSDYVARFSVQPNQTYKFTSRFRFDHDNFSTQRMELEANASFDRWSFSALYGDYAAQPALGFLERRQGLLGSARYKLTENWVAYGSLLYDLKAEKFNSTSIGLGYIDDCVILALNYATSYSYDVNGSNPQRVSTVMLQLSFRTLGGSAVSQSTSHTNSNYTY